MLTFETNQVQGVAAIIDKLVVSSCRGRSKNGLTLCSHCRSRVHDTKSPRMMLSLPMRQVAYWSWSRANCWYVGIEERVL